MVNQAVRRHPHQGSLDLRLIGLHAGEHIVHLQAALQGARVSRLNDRPVGNRVAEGKANLDQINAGGIQLAQQLAGRGHIGIARREKGNERLFLRGPQLAKAFVDGVHEITR